MLIYVIEITKTLDLKLDTRILKRGKGKGKRKRKWDVIGEKDDNGGSDERSLPSRDSLFDSPSGLDVEMFGALNDEDDDDLHLYSDD